MSQLNAPVRRSGADLDVYTGLLLAATLVLLAGAIWMALSNIEQSKLNPNDDGGPFKLVEVR